jgi:uncharacterized protein
MKVVVDTNVIVSGLLNAYSPPGEIVQMIATGLLGLCYDARILMEYKRVLSYSKFPFTQEEIDILIGKIEHDGFPSGAVLLQKDLPDKNDNKFLEVALSSKVEFLVTGNNKHFPAHTGIKIVSPRDFLQEMKKRS